MNQELSQKFKDEMGGIPVVWADLDVPEETKKAIPTFLSNIFFLKEGLFAGQDPDIREKAEFLTKLLKEGDVALQVVSGQEEKISVGLGETRDGSIPLILVPAIIGRSLQTDNTIDVMEEVIRTYNGLVLGKRLMVKVGDYQSSENRHITRKGI